MKLARAVVSNRHLIWALAIGVAIFGVVSYFTLPMQLFPDTAPPLINVITFSPGASADDVAENVSEPLEEEFGSLEGAIRIRSSSQDNLSIVSVEFDYRRNVDLAAVDAQNAISRIRGELSSNIHEPQVLKFSTSDRPVITIGVVGDSMPHTRDLAEDAFAPRLQRVQGVAGVDVFGGAKRRVLVEIDIARAKAYAIPIARVVEAIRTHNVAAPAGSLRTESELTTYRIEAEAMDIESVARLEVIAADGTPVRLEDLGSIRDGALEPDASFGIDGERAIAMQVFRTEDANTVEVVNTVTEEVDRLREEYPSLQFSIGEESASFTEQSISNLLANVWQALLLASLIIFFFIGRVKASLVAVVSMPLSYALTFGLMKLTDTELNMVTLTAVILAVGMVVDAAVVVLENISRKMDDGMSPLDAAVEGASEVQTAILAGAATTIAVLVPLLFLSGFIGKTFGPLARTLLFAFLSSVTVALTFVPVLALHAGESRLDRFATQLVRPFGWGMDQIRRFYLALLGLALRWRGMTLIVGLAFLVGGAGLMATRGMEVLPRMDGGSFFISLQTTPGSSVEATTRVVEEVEAILAAEPHVVKIQSQAGFEQGMKASATTGALGPTQGFITATLTPRTEREETIWTIEERVREKIAHVPNITSFTVREMGNTAKSTTSAPILIQISGDDPLVLDRLADELLDRLQQIPDVVEPIRNWELDQLRMLVKIDSARAEELGMTPASTARQLVMGSVGVEAGSMQDTMGGSTPIHVRYARTENPDSEELLDQPVMVQGQTGPTIATFRTYASVEPRVGQSVVTREAFAPIIEISAFGGDRPLSFTLADVQANLAEFELPRGYSLEVVGEKSDLAEARASLVAALALAVLMVYLILVSQLRSWIHPITIMASVPMSLIGVGLVLMLAGKPISMPVMVGLILLVGIVVNNAIILFEFIRQERESGADRREALIASVHVRFRPIMMTSLSTIVGMIPLAAEWALGAERFSPLALAVIGGMTTATFLTMIMVPVLYDVAEDLSSWLSGRLSRGVGAVAIVLFALPGAISAQEGPPPPQTQTSGELRMSLAEAERLAMEHSAELQAFDADARAAELGSHQAFARRLPRIELQGRYSRLSEVEPGVLTLPTAAPGQDPPQLQFGESITDQFHFRIYAVQPIFTGFGLAAAADASDLAVDIERERREMNRQDLLLDVRKTYFNALAARELVEVARVSVTTLEAVEVRTRMLFEAGRVTRADVARIDARIASARANLEQARSQLELLELRLCILIGVDQPIVLTDELDGAGGDASFEAQARSVLEERSELRLARLKTEVGEARVDLASRELWPQLSLQAGYTLANPHERYFPPRTEFNDSWDISLVLSWTVWDFGVHFNERRKAQAQLAADEHRLVHLERMTELATRQVLMQVNNAERELKAARVAEEAAQTSLELTQARFEAGRATTTDLLDAELLQTRNRAEIVRLRMSRRIALAELRRLAGETE